VFVLEGAVDPFNPKVVRASAGALSHIPVVRLPWRDAKSWLAERGVRVLAADSAGEDVRTVQVQTPWALCIGNEGAGVRTDLKAGAEQLVGIPMRTGVDSLNAGLAGAILLFALSPTFGSDTEM
jgi:TrmH family RNA methyltransferase